MTSNSRGGAIVYISLISLVAAFCLQYFVDFRNLLIRWDTGDFSYCYLVPLIFCYLVWTNRRALAGLSMRPSGWGLVAVGGSGILYLGGKLGSIETLVYLGIWTALLAMALLVMGRRVVRALAFPFLILIFIVPLPPFLNRLFTFKLKLISSALSVGMMQWAGLSVFRDGNIIDLGITQLQVVDACSGLRYVYPLILMGLVFAYLFHKSTWERIVVIGSTVPLSVVSNALRIAITGYLTLKVSPEAAEGFFHGFSGWLIFMVSFAFLGVLSWFLKVVKRKVFKKIPVRVEKSTAEPFRFQLKQLRVSYLWIATGLFVGFWAVQTAFATGQAAPKRRAFAEFPSTIGRWQGEKSYLRKEILDSLWADDYTQIHFKNRDTGDLILLFVPYYTYQGTRHTAHSPVSCLVGGGFAPLSRKILKRNFPPPFGRVKIRQMVLEKGRDRILSNYWFQQRGRIIVSEYANKWYMFWDSVTRHRTDGALVRLEMPMRPGQSVADAQAVMDAFAMELMKLLPAYVPN